MGGVFSGGKKKQTPSKFSVKGRNHQKTNRIKLEPLALPFPREWLSIPAKTGASKGMQRALILGREGIGGLAMTGPPK